MVGPEKVLLLLLLLLLLLTLSLPLPFPPPQTPTLVVGLVWSEAPVEAWMVLAPGLEAGLSLVHQPASCLVRRRVWVAADVREAQVLHHHFLLLLLLLLLRPLPRCLPQSPALVAELACQSTNKTISQ